MLKELEKRFTALEKLISESFLQPYAYASSPSSPSFWMEGLTDSLSASDPTSRQAMGLLGYFFMSFFG